MKFVHICRCMTLCMIQWNPRIICTCMASMASLKYQHPPWSYKSCTTTCASIYYLYKASQLEPREEGREGERGREREREREGGRGRERERERERLILTKISHLLSTLGHYMCIMSSTV